MDNQNTVLKPVSLKEEQELEQKIELEKKRELEENENLITISEQLTDEFFEFVDEKYLDISEEKLQEEYTKIIDSIIEKPKYKKLLNNAKCNIFRNFIEPLQEELNDLYEEYITLDGKTQKQDKSEILNSMTSIKTYMDLLAKKMDITPEMLKSYKLALKKFNSFTSKLTNENSLGVAINYMFGYENNRKTNKKEDSE